MAFYTALGYKVVGRVHLDDDVTLTVLEFSDEPVGTLELVHRPADGAVQLGTGFSHLVVQIDDLSDSCSALVAAGLTPEVPQQPGGRTVRVPRG